MRTIAAVCLLLIAGPLCAQYGPPAKDLEDAQFYMRDLMRQLEPAITEARDLAQVYKLVTGIHTRIVGKQPDLETEEAIKDIDRFIERREESGKPLSQDNLKILGSVRKEIELAAQPPYPIAALRERLHHEFVHPLERQALTNLRLIEQLETQWRMFTTRFIDEVKKETMNAVTITAGYEKQP